MISEIKKIKIEETNNKINISNKEIKDVEEKLKILLEEKRKLTSLDNTPPFSLIQKIFKRKKYNKYLKTAKENEARLLVLNEDIAFCESKIADLKQTIGNSNRNLSRFQEASSLEDLGIKSFENAVALLEKYNKDIILEHGDKILSQLPSILEDISDYCFISKTTTLPNSTKISSPFNLNEEINIDVLLGETFINLPVKNWITTVHGTINCVDQDIQSKYAYLIPFKNLNKENLVSALPNNTFFDSELSIPEGSYIIVPKSELNSCKSNLKNIEDITIIGYDDEGKETGQKLNINNTLSILMNNLNYSEQELTSAGWDNIRNQHDYQKNTEDILNNESKIPLNDIIDPSIKNSFEINRYIPYQYTKYYEKHSEIKKYICFAKALEYLHSNIGNFNIQEKKLKTTTTIDFDTKLLKADSKDKSGDRVDDVFGEFIDTLLSKDIKKIDEYLSYVDNRYIPDKGNFRDELLKATSRSKNHIPTRNKFFLNVLQRFKDLEILNEEPSTEKNKSDEIIQTSPNNKTHLSKDKKNKVIENLQNKQLENLENNDEIIIEPRVELL